MRQGTVPLVAHQHTSASVSNGKTNSNYQSVTEQAGIFAGQGGFDIYVGGNTDLKGAVIASDATPDKNKLSTGTLTFSDIQNNAEYSASSSGVNYNAGKDVATKDLGLTPNIGVKVSGDASSTTQSGIANGTIEIRDGNTDLSKLNRDTDNSLHALDKIFDKKSVQEKQEMSKLFGEVVFKAIGDLHLKEGSAEKVALDAFAGGVMAQLGGGSFASGAAGAGFNQIVINELAKIKDTAVMQWASAIAGAAAAKAVGGDAQTGGSTASSETKNNALDIQHLLQNPIVASALLLAGYIVGQQNSILNKDGKVVASWNSTSNGWEDSSGNWIGNTIDTVTAWIKSKFNPPATDTSTSNGPTVHENPENDSSIGGTTIPSGESNSGTSTTIPQTQQDGISVLTSSWNQGSFDNAGDSLQWHFDKHGSEVGADDVEQYVRKAEAFKQNLRGAQSYPVDGAVPGVVRYVKNGRYIDLAPDGTIVSFGAR